MTLHTSSVYADNFIPQDVLNVGEWTLDIHVRKVIDRGYAIMDLDTCQKYSHCNQAYIHTDQPSHCLCRLT